MGGTNPYIKTQELGKPSKPFQITYLPEGKVVVVDPANLPTSGTGLSGSVLDIALASDIDIDHACGGVCACSTCHVIIQEGLEACNEASDDENDQLERAPGLTSKSRLACQCVPDGSRNLIVEIPAWNRNAVRE